MTIFEWVLTIPAVAVGGAFLFSGIVTAGLDFDADDGILLN
ncbi:hypothetical protein [Rhodococcus sp. KBS0724]|nr:hypothetical protein [Rhodococcus sp. KBS0724]